MLVATVLLAAALLVDSAPPPAVPLSGAPPEASALAGEGFVFVTEEQGVKIYRRNRRVGLEFAVDTTFAASPERVRRVLIDYPNHAKWQRRLKENRVLGRGDGFLDVYQRMKLPVLDDRDYTLHVTWGDDGSVLWTRFAIANDRGPAPVPGVVRLTEHEGTFRLEPVDGGKATHAVHRFSIDIAGPFPAWMAMGEAKSDILEFVAGIAKQLPNYL